MSNNSKVISRRFVVKSSMFGFLAVAIPNVGYSNELKLDEAVSADSNDLFYRYLAIADNVVSEVVGASHFNLDRVKELVDPRPELAKATWDWGFGDWESAISAASHVGRKDIVAYLMSKGASPTLFTHAMLGSYDLVRHMCKTYPNLQHNFGPHGISLLRHARIGSKSAEGKKETTNYRKLIAYLEGLGDADGTSYQELTAEEKSKFLGDYKYGTGPEDGFSIQLNMREFLSLAKIGKFGGALYNTGKNSFIYNGTPSVQITFEEESESIVSLTIHEPDLELTAYKIN